MRQRGARLAFLLLAVAALPLAKAAPISVQDALGRTVTLEAPARRIVALAPHIVENLFSAGAGDRLVGAVSYSDYPAAAQALPRVGSFNAFSLERIISARPDLILMWGSGNGPGALATLERLDIPVYVSEPRQLADIPDSIRRLGQLAGTGQQSEAEARRLERGFAELSGRYRQQAPLTVFYQVWHEPLQTINGNHLISQVISLCGGRNSFADAATLAPRINLESLLARDPDVIVVGAGGEARQAWLKHWRRFPALRAVAGGAVLAVDPDYLQRPTARVLQGARELCAQLDRLRQSQSASPSADLFELSSSPLKNSPILRPASSGLMSSMFSN
ncbi:cobalamin-binding protein [Kineobactrum salinum]|uniref:Cobalamin-binding protein n=1 Tax=Kineobactrum salinum TaxID=2708301 RepID=A0A6C0U4F3_9GAMM|nr:cobalamin-binding protein [Kineobactrum salinum]QIB66723.1 cobalamin-binding protein [Kineobactrum salinum]